MNKYSESIIKYIDSHPQGVTFTELRENLKIPDSTLSRTLTNLVGNSNLAVVKFDGKYYPAEGNLAVPTFNKAMEIIHDVMKKIRFTDAASSREEAVDRKNKDRLKIILAEILGIPGHPAPYMYHNLVKEYDLLEVLRLQKLMG